VLKQPEPLAPVFHGDLNLANEVDARMYRERVAKAFDLAQLNAIIQFVIDAGGGRPPARRAAAVRALADAWIAQARSSSE
jgi:hypothetical protein